MVKGEEMKVMEGEFTFLYMASMFAIVSVIAP